MIPKTFDEVFTQVAKLARDFEKHEEEILTNKNYLEANIRQDYLDKFFVALGWDVYHEEQPNPYEREVHIEQNIQVGGRGKKADYAFFITPDFQSPRLIAEAKKPMHKMENKDYCFQTLRYGWNSNTPLAILTDFEEFLILDSRYKPSIETALQQIHKTFHYKDFADEEKFREIYFLFSREAVGEGAIEKYALGMKKARGVRKQKLFNTGVLQPVDEEFLTDLDDQRESLAKGFKNKNPELDGEALTEITQRTLDRLVFIRFLEDKLVEPSEIIDKLGTKTGSAWKDFVAESRRLDKSYNGIIFKEHAILDAPDFTPDERSFEDIRDWLSHKNSAYQFHLIPIHILGSAYERFLGKTITTTDKRAKVEEKPEVRKAGGVYYTPEYIVRYIVENTIGKLIEGKKPEEVAEMRFADIACGSGSFLLGVFDYLIAYHVRYFDKNKTRRKDALKKREARETADGMLQLTLEFKREILLNNIYGVDLDAQAVEVAQLSLYLKLLEEETTATAQQYLAGLREQMLPSLNKNIVHGNSLIDFDIMDGMLFDAKDLRKLNPMNFEQTFPDVFKNGGFDAIVGNPPYIRIQTMKETSPISVEQLKESYDSAKKGNYDIYVVFIEKALQLLKENGKVGYIVPHKFFNAKYGEEIRRIVSKGKHIEHVVHFGDEQIFDGATTYTSLFFLNKNETNEFEFIKVADLLNWKNENISKRGKVSFKEVTSRDWNFVVGKDARVFNKLRKFPTLLGNIAKIFVGLQTSADPVYILKVIESEKTKLLVHSKAINKTLKIEKDITKLLLKGAEIHTYSLDYPKNIIIFPYEVENGNIMLMTKDFLSKTYPLAWEYLNLVRSKLEAREKGKWKIPLWWQYGRNQNIAEMGEPKLLTQVLSKRASFTFDNKAEYSFVGGGNAGGYGLKLKTDINLSELFILGLLNSKILDWYVKQISTTFQGGYYSFAKRFIEQIPIRTIDFENREDKERHDKLVGLVEQMLDAKSKLSEATTDKDTQFYERFCSSIDSKIDNSVYELYELTDDEIAIVEGTN